MKNNERKQTKIIDALFSAYSPVKTVQVKNTVPFTALTKLLFGFRKQW